MPHIETIPRLREIRRLLSEREQELRQKIRAAIQARDEKFLEMQQEAQARLVLLDTTTATMNRIEEEAKKRLVLLEAYQEKARAAEEQLAERDHALKQLRDRLRALTERT